VAPLIVFLLYFQYIETYEIKITKDPQKGLIMEQLKRNSKPYGTPNMRKKQKNLNL
jgi:hypothetical protein